MSKMGKIDSNHIRSLVFRDLGSHYGTEVPLYNDELEIIKQSNSKVEKENPGALEKAGLSMERLTEERHGAIRVGTTNELKTFARIFRIMGMHPVNYYELTVEGHPIHSTAFRPIEEKALAKNPSRMFTSLLRIDLLPDEIRGDVENYLNNRKIFSEKLLDLISEWDKQKGFLSESQVQEFSNEVVKTLTWKGESGISPELFEKLRKNFSDIAADIVAAPNINHLTPVIVDIEDGFKRMNDAGMETIDVIQGPPANVKVLLNQTSFKAVARPLKLKNADGSTYETSHKTQFGEMESRHIALKEKGRELYDIATAKTNSDIAKQMKEEVTKFEAGGTKATLKDKSEIKRRIYGDVHNNAFKDFPKNYDQPGENSWGYFKYEPTVKGLNMKGSFGADHTLDELLRDGIVKATRIIYEDFLPASAAGIFDSNLTNVGAKLNLKFGNMEEYKAYENKMKAEFEKALGEKVIDSHDLYKAQEAKSIIDTYTKLGIPITSQKSNKLHNYVANDPVAKLYGRDAA